ncbi:MULTISPECIES: hypothetical protein [unclassified Paraburkholderia]|nr:MULTISPECIES: hypothetical protein [unclassified Paraburkholderia]
MFVAIRQRNQRVLAFLAVLLFVGALQAWAAGNWPHDIAWHKVVSFSVD